MPSGWGHPHHQTDANSSQYAKVRSMSVGTECPPLGESGAAVQRVGVAPRGALFGVEEVVDRGKLPGDFANVGNAASRSYGFGMAEGVPEPFILPAAGDLSAFGSDLFERRTMALELSQIRFSKSSGAFSNGRMRWICLPTVIRISSMRSSVPSVQRTCNSQTRLGRASPSRTQVPAAPRNPSGL
jgi:hypothetical protein